VLPDDYFNRDSLIADYAQQILDGMDMKTMEVLFMTLVLKDNLSSYSDEELIEEVTEYNPELLEV
jgi:predicted nucleotidyltransferase